MAKVYKLDKLALAEHYYRGGFELGYSTALADVRASIAPVEAHVVALSQWASDDPEVEREPPALALAAAASFRGLPENAD